MTELIEDGHVEAACRPGTIVTCRYLTMSAAGWACAKFSSIGAHIDERVEAGIMRATGDNCAGPPPIGDWSINARIAP